jgi:hypothetical protein
MNKVSVLPVQALGPVTLPLYLGLLQQPHEPDPGLKALLGSAWR